jgi:hypothetical protein
MKIGKILALLLSLTLACAAQAQIGWKKLRKSFYPFFLNPFATPNDWTFHDRAELESADKKLHLSYSYDSFISFIKEGGDIGSLGDLPEAQRVPFLLKRDYNSWSPQDGEINYSRLKKNWFVVSGTKDGREFYLKAFYSFEPDEGRVAIHALKFTYPASERKVYDPVCSRIMRSLPMRLQGLPNPS